MCAEERHPSTKLVELDEKLISWWYVVISFSFEAWYVTAAEWVTRNVHS